MPCAKCGTKNPDDVTECLYCGERLKPEPAKQEKGHMPILPRLLVSLAVGLLVFVISSHAAFQQFCVLSFRYRPSQKWTLQDIGRVRDAVEAYRQLEGVLPKKLNDFPPATSRVDKTGWPLDWWSGQQRLNYWTDGTHYRISSYGLDGKPGGVGFDYDLSTDDLLKYEPPKYGRSITSPTWPRQANPTFQQFVTDRGYPVNSGQSGSGRMMFLSSILAGAVAFFLGFWTTRRTLPIHRDPRAIIVGLLITTLGTLFIALMYIIPLHAPAGH
jgi:hypothetical protein